MMPHSTIVFETITSEVLKDNPLHDSPTRRVPIYLPPGYDDNADVHYPSLYLLTGFTGRGTMLLNDAAWEENIAERLDRLIAQKVMRPMIVVMPDCFTRYGGSQYINSSAVGRYEDHVADELVPYVDQKYRTINDRNYRAVAGKSSGGYGSVMLAMRRPNIFGLMASHSGDMYFEHCYKEDLIGYVKAISKYGGLEKFLQSFETIRPRDRDFHFVINAVAMSSCYSPNPDSPVGFDIPIDEETGEIREDVWEKWQGWDPVYLAERYADALRSLRLIYLDAGTRDEFHLQYGARIFTKRLRALNIPFVHEEFEDGHFGVSYRYDRSFKAISEAMPGN
jgi:enterochelin esterase family protein